MKFHWLGEWGMVYFEWPERQLGMFLLVLYALLFLVLFVRITRNYYHLRREFAGTWAKRVLSLIGWAILAVACANTLKLQWTTPSLPIGLDQSREPILFLAYIPIALAARQLGAGSAMLVGMIVGWMCAAYGNGRILHVFEVGTFGLIASILLYQDYRGRLGWLARQPLFAVPWAGATMTLLTAFSNFAHGDPDMSVMSTFSASIDVAAANLPVYLIQALIAGAVLQAVYALWPHLRAVQDPARTPPYARSISLRFLYAFLPSWAIVVIVVLYAVMSQAIRVALTQAIDEIAHVTGNVSLELPYFQWTGQPFLHGLALDDDLQSTDYDQREASLQRGMQTLPFFNQIALIDSDDPERIPRNIFPPPDKQHQLTAAEQRLLELTLRDGSPQISQVHRDADGTPIISFLVPVRNALAPQELEGALIGRVHIATNYQLQSMISDLQPPGDAGASPGTGFLINDQNQIVAHPDSARILDDWAPNLEPSVEHEPPTPLARVYEDLNGSDGTRQLVYVLATEGMPWRIVVTWPYENILAQATEISLPLLILFVVAGVVVSVAVPIYTNHLTRPLTALSQAASEIAANRLDAPVHITGEDEVGQLGRSFEQMRQRLSERMDELSLLLHISREVSASMELAPSLRPILRGAIRSTGAQAARIVLINERGRPRQIIGEGVAEMQEALVRLDPALDVIVKRNQELQIEDLTRGKRAPPVELIQSGVRAAIGLPLRLRDVVTGVMWVAYQHPRTFAEHDLQFLYTLAGQAAVVAANAQLFEDVQGERSRLKAILSSTNDVVIVIDAQGDILLSNPAALGAYGIIAEEAVGLPFREVVTDEPLRQLLACPMEEGAALTDEIVAPDGRTFSASVSSLSGGGRVVTLRDITYLVELDQMKSDFVNSVSHDLRSPLTYMRGYTSMIPMVGELNERQQGFVDKIHVGIEHMTALIDDLLDIGKIEAGVGIEIERCWLPGLVQAVVDDLGMRAAQQHVELTASLPSDTPATMADPTLIRQAIHNLIDNAIKYTPGPGAVEVSLRNHGDALVVTVRDTGIGIAPEDQHRLFEKFYRIKRRDTAHITGTGLGLAIVKSIADRHAGRVWVESKLDEGSTFHFSIPLIPPPEEPESA
ncbi:MAG: HAMP domain-containing protein [Anaerolineae bacterium]|nr:HAMP domain-containing protein [Anaerolineae bacterium]